METIGMFRDPSTIFRLCLAFSDLLLRFVACESEAEELWALGFGALGLIGFKI